MLWIIFKSAYQSWHTIDKEGVANEVKKGTVTPEQYKEIVGEDYAESAPTDE